MTVGFIGLGIMGSRMVANLQEAGVDLVVHNRTKAKARALLDGGAAWADTPAGVGRQADVLFTMLAHPEAVSQTASGSDGFLNALRIGTLWVDCSTVNPSFSRQMAEEARARGIRFVDAPVAGTKGPAGEGTLLFIAGGAPDDVAEARPYFDIMGRQTLHMGAAGAGTAMKVVVNLLLAQAMVAFSEAMALGQAQGIDRDVLLDALLGGPVVAPFLAGKRDKIEGDTFAADFPLKWMEKDLHLAAQTAYEEGVALPAGAVVKEVYALATRYGLGDQDFSAIYRFLNERTGAGDAV